MKNKIMKKWVKALRSGKFKQGKDALKQSTRNGQAKHCCLGVLCELYNQDRKKNHKKTLTVKEQQDDGCFKYGLFSFDECTGYLPGVVAEWAGLEDCAGEFKNYYEAKSEYAGLADMNDNGVTFKTIANTIEKQWENL